MEKVDSEVAMMLAQGENILLAASQSKSAPGGSISSPSKIYITTHRVLFKSAGMFGMKSNIIDIRYEEIATVMLKRGVFSTEIMLKPRSSPNKIVLPAVDKQVALQVSTFIQKGMRGELAPKPAPKAQVAKPDSLVKLERLMEMKGQGMISEAEFQILKEEMMLTAKPEIDTKPPSPPHRPEVQPFRREARPPAPQPAPVLEKQAQAGVCRYCSVPLPRAAKFCPECGKSQLAGTNIWKMCPSCDMLAESDAVFCASCNERFPESLS